MTTMAQLRDRQRVRVALVKGEPVASEDHEHVRQLLAQVRWYGPLALVFAILCCLWLRMFLFGHGGSHWTALLWVFGTGLMTTQLLWQRRRIMAGAADVPGRGDG
jgi:uncharacterized membrane protein YjjP (DUF1212 family)